MTKHGATGGFFTGVGNIEHVSYFNFHFIYENDLTKMKRDFGKRPKDPDFPAQPGGIVRRKFLFPPVAKDKKPALPKIVHIRPRFPSLLLRSENERRSVTYIFQKWKMICKKQSVQAGMIDT